MTFAFWAVLVWFSSSFFLWFCYTLRAPWGFDWRGRDIAAVVFGPFVLLGGLLFAVPRDAFKATVGAIRRGW